MEDWSLEIYEVEYLEKECLSRNYFAQSVSLQYNGIS